MTAAASDPSNELERKPVGLSPTARLVIAVVLSCALVAAVVGGIILTLRYTHDDSSVGGTSVNSSMAAELRNREQAQAAASAFAANVNSYSVKDIDGYQKRLVPLLTPSFAQSFNLFVSRVVQLTKVTKMTSEGQILRTAVSSIDPHNATALVVADAHVTSALGERIRHFRWKVTLVKPADKWLVDNFDAVA